MGLISIPNTFTVGAVIIASQHNSNFSVIYSEFNGSISDANISGSANISDSKLAAITTAGKVSGASLTSLASTPSGAGVLPVANGGIPSGVIMMWSGTISTIPTGFFLCNGSNSTPDLRNLFIVGADADAGGIAKSTITGSALQSHATGIVGNHVHAVTGGKSGNVVDGPILFDATATDATPRNTNTNTGGNTNNISPFYALAFIMKS